MNTYKVRYKDEHYRRIESIDITCELSELLQKIMDHAKTIDLPEESNFARVVVYGKWPDGSPMALVIF